MGPDWLLSGATHVGHFDHDFAHGARFDQVQRLLQVLGRDSGAGR